MRLRSFLYLLMVMMLVAGACGDGDDGGSDESSNGETDTETDSEDGGDGEGDADQIEVQMFDEDEVSQAGETVTADPLPDRGPEPSGTLVYAWHTAFAPSWLDPSENTASISQYVTQYILHDAMLKHMPGQPFAPSLAEEYTVAEDYTSATFKLREGLTFHDGSPLTTEDVQFSYENYSGANADFLQSRTESIEIVDDLTITFNFNAPFLDFITIYGSPASGAGWILPSDYYQEVGPEGFIANPIGAGPFKFVSNSDNTEIVYEANTDYWRKNPGVQDLVFRAIPDSATRFAALQTGELDLANVFPGDLLEALYGAPDIDVAPTSAVPFWLEFPGWEDEDNPFNDPRVREAVSLALDRQALSDAETLGAGPIDDQWIPTDFSGALDPGTTYEYNTDRARELLAEAGYPDGFDVAQLTPLPPYFSLGERVVTQLSEVGIRTSLNQMERGAFLAAIGSGEDDALPGIIMNISGAPGDAASRVRSFALCDGSASRICDEEGIDAPFAEYEASTDPGERTEILDGIQQYMIDENIFVYVYTLALTMAQGPDVVEPADQVWAQIPQYVYPGPWEDITVSG